MTKRIFPNAGISAKPYFMYSNPAKQLVSRGTGSANGQWAVQEGRQNLRWFSATLPKAAFARGTFKNPYKFDFLTIGKRPWNKSWNRLLVGHLQKF